MKDHIAVAGLLQGALERLDQMVGKLSDKSDRIRKKDGLSIRKDDGPGGGIQRREQLILRQDPRVGQAV